MVNSSITVEFIIAARREVISLLEALKPACKQSGLRAGDCAHSLLAESPGFSLGRHQSTPVGDDGAGGVHCALFGKAIILTVIFRCALGGALGSAKPVLFHSSVRPLVTQRGAPWSPGIYAYG